ncbi:MAG: hypothetical protein LBH17_02210, partial [Oscillospiraceae bacterium]|nr:hypothetical protein [Oscillospiraceae bacterium]
MNKTTRAAMKSLSFLKRTAALLLCSALLVPRALAADISEPLTDTPMYEDAAVPMAALDNTAAAPDPAAAAFD